MLSEKKMAKIETTLGTDTVKEMEAMDSANLKRRIVEASKAKAQVAKELEDNKEYQRIKEDKSYLESGKREVNKRQNAVIDLALHLMEAQGEQQ
jgi:hypothetical protein